MREGSGTEKVHPRVVDSTPRVGVIGPHPPYRGGIAQFTEQFSRALLKAGVPIEPISFSRQYPSLFFPGKSQEIPAGTLVEASGQQGGTLEGPSPARLLDSINPFSWRKTADHLIQAGVSDVAIMHWMPFFAPAYATIARRLRRAGVRVTAIVHNANPHERQPFAVPLTRWFLSNCDRIVALSETVKRDIVAMRGTVDVDVRPHPVYDQFGPIIEQNEARKHIGLPSKSVSGQPLLLFFGLIRRYKGLDVLLDAMTRMKEKPFLQVAGEWYEDRAEAESFIAAHGLSEQVIIRDTYIPDNEVAALFSAADAVVQPYRSATQSGVVQTAFHFGRPVVVTGVGGLPEMVRHGEDGLIVAPEDPDALAAALDDLLTGDTQAKLAEGALRARERHSWPAFIEPFLKHSS